VLHPKIRQSLLQSVNHNCGLEIDRSQLASELVC
jgi:hypothetical protein